MQILIIWWCMVLKRPTFLLAFVQHPQNSFGHLLIFLRNHNAVVQSFSHDQSSGLWAEARVPVLEYFVHLWRSVNALLTNITYHYMMEAISGKFYKHLHMFIFNWQLPFFMFHFNNFFEEFEKQILYFLLGK